MFFKTNLLHLRKQDGLTQENVASLVGVKRGSIGAYEEGRATPNYETLIKIAEVFDVSIDTLLAEDLTGTHKPERLIENEKEYLWRMYTISDTKIKRVVTQLLEIKEPEAA